MGDVERRVPEFSIIIVSYQSEDWIGACLEGLADQTFQDFETIIVDNASTDRSAAIVDEANLNGMRLIQSSENLGFAKACNLAAKESTGKWVVFLNPDTVARPDWLEQIVSGQARHPDTTAFACAQYELGRSDVLDGVGDAYFGFGIPWRGGFGHHVSAMPGEGECFSPCGAAAVVRRDVFQRVGGFDERYFCYCEDVDLGFRLRLMGERCVFLPGAAVDHKGSAISGRHTDFTIYHGTRNRMWTYFKNMPLDLLILTLPGHFAISLYLLIKAAFIGRFKATSRGMIDGIRGIPAIWRSRKRYDNPEGRLSIRRAMSWNFFEMHQRRPCVREFQIQT